VIRSHGVFTFNTVTSSALFPHRSRYFNRFPPICLNARLTPFNIRNVSGIIAEIETRLSPLKAYQRIWHHGIVQRKAEYIEGSEAASNFERAMRRLFQIPRSETPERPKRGRRTKKIGKGAH